MLEDEASNYMLEAVRIFLRAFEEWFETFSNSMTIYEDRDSNESWRFLEPCIIYSRMKRAVHATILPCAQPASHGVLLRNTRSSNGSILVFAIFEELKYYECLLRETLPQIAPRRHFRFDPRFVLRLIKYLSIV